MAVYFELCKFAHLPFVYYSMKPTIILALAILLHQCMAISHTKALIKSRFIAYSFHMFDSMHICAPLLRQLLLRHIHMIMRALSLKQKKCRMFYSEAI